MPDVALEALVRSVNLDAHGRDVTITRPVPNDVPVETTGIWELEVDEPDVVGRQFTRREPRRVLAVPRSDTLPEVERGSSVIASERSGGALRTWMVEGQQSPAQPDRWRLILRLVE